MSDPWLEDDAFADPDDPKARERAERRAEREQKRRQKAEREEPTPPPPTEPPKPAPPPPKRSPEQEFWNEDPTPEPEPPSAPSPPPAAAPAAGQSSGGGGLRGLFRRKQEPVPAEPDPPAAKDGKTPSADEKAPTAESTAAEPPTAQQPLPAPVPAPDDPTRPTTKEAPVPDAEAPSPATAESPPPDPEAPSPPTGEHPTTDPEAPNPPTGEHDVPDPDSPAQPSPDATGEHLVPDPEAPNPATGEHPVAPHGDPLASGQTSEEWAALPAARNDWDDFSDGAYHEEGNPEMAGAARTGRRSGDDGGRRGGFLGSILRHPFRIVALILLIVVLWFANALFQPFHGAGHGRVEVRIPKGASVSEVGDLLSKRGVIDDSTLFQIRVTLAGKRSDLFAGRFGMEKGMSYGEAIDVLSKEPSAKAKPNIATVTIPEGYTRGQAAELISEDGVPGNYKKATVKSKYLNPAKYGGKGAKTLEGFLFPDTFELKAKATVKSLVQLQLQDFQRKIKRVNMKYAKSKNLTVFDVVTIASMIEREAGVAKQRKLVASVIYNRLHEGMPLGIDATIRFATGNYEKPLTESQLATDSPYNTRTNAGLPPGPINSPGLAALQAAAHPAKTDYLFYVNDPNSCEELAFSENEEEFLADAERYENAREANGGNAPSTCGN